jgi:hypothetical protein
LGRKVGKTRSFRPSAASFAWCRRSDVAESVVEMTSTLKRSSSARDGTEDRPRKRQSGHRWHRPSRRSGPDRPRIPRPARVPASSARACRGRASSSRRTSAKSSESRFRLDLLRAAAPRAARGPCPGRQAFGTRNDQERSAVAQGRQTAGPRRTLWFHVPMHTDQRQILRLSIDLPGNAALLCRKRQSPIRIERERTHRERSTPSSRSVILTGRPVRNDSLPAIPTAIARIPASQSAGRSNQSSPGPRKISASSSASPPP